MYTRSCTCGVHVCMFVVCLLGVCMFVLCSVFCMCSCVCSEQDGSRVRSGPDSSLLLYLLEALTRQVLYLHEDEGMTS